MGNTCGCSEDVDNEQEVKANAARGTRMQKQSSGKRDGNATKIGSLTGTEIKMTPELKQRIKQENLQYTEELAFENGSIYKGYMKDGMRHGPGTQIWPDGARYTGEWRFNKANGNGTFYHADGDIYNGDW